MNQSHPSKGPHKVSNPHWSLATSFWVALGILAFTTVVVLLFVQQAVWIELEILALVVGVFMTAFYSHVLYHGIRFSDNETLKLNLPKSSPLDYSLGWSGGGFGNFTAAGASEGVLGVVLGFLLDIVVCLILALVIGVVLWFGANILVVSIFAVALPLFYLFRRSISFLMRYVEECHGKFLRSLAYGFLYALTKTATLCLIVFASHEIALLVRSVLDAA